MHRRDHLVHRARRLRLNIGLGIVAVERDGLTVIDQFDIGIAAGAPDAELVGPTQFELTRARKLDLLQLRRNDLDVAVEGRGQCVLCAEIVGRGFQELGWIVSGPKRSRQPSPLLRQSPR